MNQEHVLSILYDLSMVMSGETHSATLIKYFLQRLMFHTGFPCGMYLEHIMDISRGENGQTTAFLCCAIGDSSLMSRCGQPLPLPSRLLCGDSSVITDQALLSQSFGKENAWQTALKLQLGDHRAFLLLAHHTPDAELPLTTMFHPVLRNFSKALELCRTNERHMEKLEAANRELETFCYSVSHDLRAPLRGIDGFSHALLEDYHDTLDEQGKDYLQRIRKGVQRMGMLIDDLLRLSRTTQASLNREKIDMTAMAKAVATELQEREPERKARFTIAEGLQANADPALLGIVLNNLFDNAWKYTGKEEKTLIEFATTDDEGETVFYISDNGTGFDMQYADKLFGVFQRLHREDEFSGTGIGLATVQRVIQRHGGRIWAESSPGEGATFFFTLPTYTSI